MNPEEYILDVKTRFGDQSTKDGQLIRDLEDRDLLRRMIQRWPGDREKIIGLETYLSEDEIPPALPPTEAQTTVEKLTGGLANAFRTRWQAQKDALGKSIDGEQTLGSGLLQAAGQGAGFIGDVGFEAIKAVTPEYIREDVAGAVEEIGGFAPVQAGMEAYGNLKEAHPEVIGNLEGAANIASIIPGVGATVKGAQLGAKGAMKVGGEVAARASAITGDILDARRVANIEKAKKTIDETVGSIVQGKPGDVARARRALGLIDTEGVKTYKELNERIGDNVEALSEKLDEFLDQQTGTLKSDDVVIETKVGDTVVRQKFVDDALDQLSELYSTIKDAPSAARIEDVRARFNDGGLTRKEINNIAKEYGREFGSKAFGKTGEALTSVNAQAYENTRKGVKAAFRNTVNGDIPKQLDSQISDLLQTSKLTKKMEERVNALYQKVQKRGIMEKLARKVGDLVNIATFNTVSGFVSKFIPSNVGLKTLNSIDLEERLSKNLSKIDDLLKKTSDEEIVDGLAEILKGD